VTRVSIIAIIAIIIIIIIIIIVLLKLLNQRPAVYTLIEKAVMFNTCRLVTRFWQNSE